eukprot:NP_001262596.1 ENL/AF9-related, isoform C [Drosophila melanogaster]
MAVKVQFEIGHTSKLRSKKTPHPQAFTHDWEIYVQGVNKADISAFVEKVVFVLHESFPKPKRVVKEPPYAIQESGYAGFLLPVEIYFRNRDEPKRIVYQYDLVLQSTGPPQHHVEVKTHIFEAPSEEFRTKLMRGGGVPVFGANIGAGSLARTLSPSVGSGETAHSNEMSGVKAKGVPGTISMNSDLNTGKKHKSRSEDPGKSNAFSALFGPPITKTSVTANNMAQVPVSKHSPEAKSAAVGGKGVFHEGREKASKDRDKSSGGDKPREKDKKDRHGRDKDRKSSKSGDGKHERDKEKSKKDKSRDKEREREQGSGNTTSANALTVATSVGTAGGLVKHTASPKPGKPNEMGAPSPKKTANDSAAGAVAPTSRSKERDEHKSVKSESKDKERSSSKKSKKDKKDKDKQRDESKDKRMPKDERPGQSDSPASGNLQSAHLQQQSQVASTGKATPTSVGSNSSSSMVSNIGKQKEEATGKHSEKAAESKGDKSTSNGNATDTKKSHKHKKKEKSKDKEKERNDRDKDKDKERDKDKLKEREKDKQHVTGSEKSSTVDPSPKLEGASPATEGGAPDKTPVSASASSGSKKEKHKKSKEKSSGKDEKRQREAVDKQADTKHTGKSQQSQSGQSKTPSNLDLSDMDSAQSAPDLAATNALAAAAAATLQHSDSSNSSFPDLPARSSSQQKPTKGNTGSGKETKSTVKEHKGKSKQNDKTLEKNTDKTEKPDKTPDPKVDKSEKSEKEDKKRNRRSSQSSNSGSGAGVTGAFIEPPVKASKKEQGKAAGEKSKSPSLRPPRETNSTGTGGGTPNAGAGFLAPPSSSPSNNHSAAVAASLNNNNNNNNNNTNSNSSHSPGEMTTPGQLQLPTEYLSELQELHHKIMTLQDNEELQHVVEMIAATGCYEITHKTFDFDLCKLDRGTVQRLQEFLATSVS